MSATPVGYLYTPQQLMGSVRYGSGVLLGNWREDDALGEMRLMDYVSNRDTGNLTLLKQKSKLGPQLAPATLSKTPADGVMRSGDVMMLKSDHNGGALAVSLGQAFEAHGEQDSAREYAVFASDSSKPVLRNAIKITAFDGAAADGEPLLYGQAVKISFSNSLAIPGNLASCPSSRSGLSTQLINKQEVYMQALHEYEKVSYDCAWVLQPLDVDSRVPAQGTPVAAGMPFVISHAATNRRLAGVQYLLPSDFGMEYSVCCHTYTAAGKVNKLMRETMGRPSSDVISQSETSENSWSAVYA